MWHILMFRTLNVGYRWWPFMASLCNSHFTSCLLHIVPGINSYTSGQTVKQWSWMCLQLLQFCTGQIYKTGHFSRIHTCA
jgi:hypothetical protein